jgi:hypothetical protein
MIEWNRNLGIEECYLKWDGFGRAFHSKNKGFSGVFCANDGPESSSRLDRVTLREYTIAGQVQRCRPQGQFVADAGFLAEDDQPVYRIEDLRGRVI